jgi:hypothetical protein
VFRTGDAHVFMLNVLGPDPEAFRSDPAHPAAAIEYVAGSVTSPGPIRAEADVQAGNPWNRQYDAGAHGYALVRLDATAMTTEYRRSDITRPDGITVPIERFVQPVGANAVSRTRVAL